ncbi:1-acyl-sn-glycerol-3-phosphate acyltransferase [Jeongeupia sp. USM3]|uniref:lysophospholipid acyltransferase family protein n=1 Tax=Jeongeupia sp. USM3 TaxID=1906741 RepID=UPI00089DEC33|nr:lysophospholipid acyltransferase family protein [Jeongeupia sp. USM3]AOY01340.1 1-acyl-sn-glycerol-3-phosphate acyltransferase [Jeongeupia sp. USM3]
MIWIRSILYWLGMAIITPPYAIFCILILPLPPVLRTRIITGWSRVLLWWLGVTCGLRGRIVGEENIPAGPAMIVCKHQSAWETMALQMVFPPMVFVIKRELLKLPFFGWGLKATSPIAIDRSNRSEAQRLLMEQGQDRIGHGFWITIFPEGTRVAPGERGKYKPGGARLAIALGIPVVPVMVNAGEYWPRNSFLKHPGTVTMKIGKAIDTAGRDALELTREIEEWIEGELAAMPDRGPCFPR